jgi:lipoprotein-anchoring transpeptidase ErfK/SrfK
MPSKWVFRSSVLSAIVFHMGRRHRLAVRASVAAIAAVVLVSAGGSGSASGGSVPAAPATPAAALRPGAPPGEARGPAGQLIPLVFRDRQAISTARRPPVHRLLRAQPALLVHVRHDIRVTSRPGGGKAVGIMPDGSKYYGFPIVAWVIERSVDGRYGLVTLPYSGSNRTGWIALRGLRPETTPITVVADLSRHEVTVERLDEVILRFPAATGAPGSRTPPGRYFVTDRVPFARGSFYGSFAFGISGIQTDLPPGWAGGNQLAIHGTNSPGTIGLSVSAGCLRVSEYALGKLRPLLKLGTPVVIKP